jgi:HPr kinase/phosphorylase
VLWHDVQVDVQDAPAFEQIRLIAQHASHDQQPEAAIHLAVGPPSGDGYRVYDGGDECARVASVEDVLDVVFGRVYRRATELASLKGWVRVHGALVGVNGRRIAVVGAGSFGKSTLCIGVLCQGGQVEVDESFVTRDGQALGVARRFHIKPGTAAVVPAATWLADAPTFGDPPNRAVDPTEHGFAWDLHVGPIDDMVLLRRTDGPSRLESTAATEAVREVMGQTFPLLETRGSLVRQVSNLVARCRCHLLHVGPDGLGPSLLAMLVLPPVTP